jgi:hypothetical protein
MIYMVEMALLDTARRAEWEVWYTAHQHHLLSIPGIHASQRFECIHPAASPFVALHEVDGPDVFTSDAYRNGAGPANTGEWQTKMGNWHRNLFRGLDHTPNVPMDARLVIVERGTEGSLPRDAIVRWLEAVGLDQSVRRRGIVVMAPSQANLIADTPGIRVLKPLAERLTPSSPSP